MAQRKKDKKKQSSLEGIAEAAGPAKVTTVLHFALENACNLPNLPNIYLTLEQNCIPLKSLNRALCGNCVATLENLSDDVENNPCFYLSIEQDSFDTMNNLCDNPLVITLMQHRKGDTNQEEDNYEEEESFEEETPIAKGHIDLLQFMGKTKVSSVSINSFLYPLSMDNDMSNPSCCLLWNVYSTVPMLKELTFSNMMFITLESVFNLNCILDPELDPSDYVVSISLKSPKIGDDIEDFVKQPFCSFKYGTIQTKDEQNFNIKWERLKVPPTTDGCLGLYTGNRVSTSMTADVYRNDYLDIDLKSVQSDSSVFTFNSMHRLLLAKEIDLKDVAELQDGLLFDIYPNSSPNEIVLQGSVDLAPLLFPTVRDCRFAVALAQQKAEETSETKRNSRSESISNFSSLAPFLLLRIVLQKHICEMDKEIVFYEKTLKMSVVSDSCLAEDCKNSPPLKVIQKSSYKNLENVLESLIEKISGDCVQDDGCNRANLLNALLHVVATDFNQRCQTNSNSEFYNLMTTVYNDVSKQIKTLVNNYDLKKSSQQYCLPETEKIHLIMKLAKTCIEIGSPMQTIGEYIIEMLKNKCKCDEVNFYIGLHFLERQCFDGCKELINGVVENDINHFYGQLILTYISIAEADFEFKDFSEYLLSFLEKNPFKKEIWILLFCVYKEHGYRPGQYHCQMKYENLFDYTTNQEEIKASRWEIYYSDLSCLVDLQKDFHIAFRIFLQLGLYKFAQKIFNFILCDFTTLEKYRITSGLHFLQNDVEVVQQQIQEANTAADENLKWWVYRFTGDLAFVYEDCETAIHNYEWIFHDPEMESYRGWKLIFLRCGYWEIMQKNYDKAITYFTKCSEAEKEFCSYYGLGISLFETCNLRGAEHCFGKCTDYRIHIPDLWAYLVLVNYELDQKQNAMKLYQYCKMRGDLPLDAKLAETLEEKMKL